MRHIPGPTVCKAKREMRNRCMTVHMDKLCSRGKADRPFKSGQPVYSLEREDGGGLATTGAARRAEAFAFYEKLFQDPNSDLALPDWIHRQWTPEEQQQEVPLSLPL